jgi:hypothetical protein
MNAALYAKKASENKQAKNRQAGKKADGRLPP